VKAIEFEGKLVGQRSIHVPDDIAQELPADSLVRVILLFDTGDPDWQAMSAANFAAAYAPEDDVYEELLNGPPAG
jgi:hypothetical protein